MPSSLTPLPKKYYKTLRERGKFEFFKLTFFVNTFSEIYLFTHLTAKTGSNVEIYTAMQGANGFTIDGVFEHLLITERYSSNLYSCFR